MITGKYPNLRLRRNRKTDWARRLVEESSLSSNDLILPIFLIDGKNKVQSISLIKEKENKKKKKKERVVNSKRKKVIK
jgi:porphobilinogen synthase